jgi:hypothetical protein
MMMMTMTMTMEIATNFEAIEFIGTSYQFIG